MVAITHSIYGNFDSRRLHLSILSQQNSNTDLEIIVSEQNTEPKFRAIAEELGIDYVFTKPKVFVDGIPVYNPGEIRNHALRRVTSEFTYTNDADYLFPNPDYFLELIREFEKEGVPLFNAPMKRLGEDEFEAFYNLVQQVGINAATKSLDTSHYFMTGLTGVYPELKIIDRNGQVFTIKTEDFEMWRSSDELKGQEPKFFHETVHRGSNFGRTEQFRAVNGYSRAYKTWGFEDTDIQWKLGELFGIREIVKEERFGIIHLDHPKGYINTEATKRNKAKFEARRELGIDKAIEVDSHE